MIAAKNIETVYREHIAANDWREDSAQLRCARALERVKNDILREEYTGRRRVFSLASPFYKRKNAKDGHAPAPKGCYIYGPVGRGKTMLTGLLLQSLSARVYRRMHFHDFMRNAHEQMKHFREAAADDPVKETARALTGEIKLFCFDEFQIFDIADAMLLYRLFKEIFKRGVCVIATSNTAPEHLYKDGLQREHILPFIELLRKQCDIVALETADDYRARKKEAQEEDRHYFLSGDKGAHALFSDKAHAFAAGEKLTPAEEIFAGGRKALCGMAAGRHLLMSDFDTLFRAPLGAADYHILAEKYGCFALQFLPRLTKADKQPLTRMIHFIDVLYEKKRRLICLADAEPADLYDDDPAGQPPGTARMISRLQEMRSVSYIADIRD